MKLVYYDRELNFGDALNKMIFEHYIPDLLNENEEEILLGIGTVLGLEKVSSNVKKVVVFSSGFGYGNLPLIDNRYEIICIRGPLTAKKLQLDESLAITDGAVLLRGMKFNIPQKEYKWSYIPHKGSEEMFDRWKEIITKAGGNFISPINEPDFVINEILKSEVIVAEAMHGAIVADILRVPWIAASAYKHINAFKWNDWLYTMNLKYTPVYLEPLFNRFKVTESIKLKVKFLRNSFLLRFLIFSYLQFQRLFKEKHNINRLKNILKNPQLLSDEKVLDMRYNQLLEKLEVLRKSQIHH